MDATASTMIEDEEIPKPPIESPLPPASDIRSPLDTVHRLDKSRVNLRLVCYRV